ncbi:MAG: hypothetical protein WD396_03110 [Pseudohongiellaceae bacterium]
MGDEPDAGISEDECWQTYVGQGVRLEINAHRITEGEWALAVVNEAGVASNWLEFFATGEAALAAGLKAIEEEGVEAFTSIEGFDYLQDGSKDGERH